jgi:hypothetical protein
MFREDYPTGGYGVLSKPPLGKCSIKIHPCKGGPGKRRGELQIGRWESPGEGKPLAEGPVILVRRRRNCLAGPGAEDWAYNNNNTFNNTFTWSGPSGVRDYTGQRIIIHLLGLAPAGYLAAPDSGASAGCGVVHAKYPYRESVDSLCH